MLDSTDYVMPLDCTVTDAELDEGIPVDVEVAPGERQGHAFTSGRC